MCLWLVSNEAIHRCGTQVERVMQLPDVPGSQAHQVAGSLMAPRRMTAQIEPRRGLDRLTQALSTFSQEGLRQASDKSYYDVNDKGPVNVELAQRVSGEVGKVAVASSLWHKNVPRSLLRVYTAWDKKYASEVLKVECLAVHAMLDSIREAGPLKKCHNKHATSKARVIPKGSQKCSLIFACVGINKADVRKRSFNFRG